MNLNIKSFVIRFSIGFCLLGILQFLLILFGFEELNSPNENIEKIKWWYASRSLLVFLIGSIPIALFSWFILYIGDIVYKFFKK
jgi:hypothetical protein